MSLADLRPPASERRGRVFRHALRREMAHRCGYCWWTVDHAGWVVTLDSPDRQEFSGRTLAEDLAWCLGWLMDRRLAVTPRGSRRPPDHAGMLAMQTLDPTPRLVAPVGGHFD